MKKNWSTFTTKEVTGHVNLNTNSCFSIKTNDNLFELNWIWTTKEFSQSQKNNLKKINNIRYLFAVKYLNMHHKTLMINCGGILIN